MKKLFPLFGLLLFISVISKAASPLDSLPVRGFCIAAPGASHLAPFLQFIKDELVPRHINTLVLRVDFNPPTLSSMNFTAAASRRKIP